jgi:hypothetical protein
MTRTNFQATVLNERFILSWRDLTEADGSQTFSLMPLPKGSIVKGVRTKQTEAFSNNGGGATATAAVGSAAGATNTFSPAYDVAAAVADTTAQMVAGWKAATYAADTLTATIASNVNVNTMTAGVVVIDVEILLMPDLTGCGPTGNALATGGQV